jgi:hypothetical protein
MIDICPDDVIGCIAEFLDYRTLCLLTRTSVGVRYGVSHIGNWLWGHMYGRSFPDKTRRNYRNMQLQYKKRVATSMRELMRRVTSINFSADIEHKCNLALTYTMRISTLRNADHVLHPLKRRNGEAVPATSCTHLATELSRAKERLRRVEVQLVDLRRARRIHELVGEQDPWYFQNCRKRKRADSVMITPTSSIPYLKREQQLPNVPPGPPEPIPVEGGHRVDL